MGKPIHIIAVLAIPGILFAQSVPYLSGRVNDYAGILSADTRSDLESRMKSHEEATSNQVVVLTVTSLEGAVLEEFSLNVAQTWGLGQKGKDNGVLLLIAKDDRKVRIEVGYGLEGTLTDARCSEIIRFEIVPRFKNGDFDGGVFEGVTAILGTIEGTYVSAETDGDYDSEEIPFWGILFFIGIFLAVVGTHSVIAILNKGFTSYFHGAFLIPFWLFFPVAVFQSVFGILPVILYVIVFIIAKIWFTSSPVGQKFQTRWMPKSGGGSSSGGGWSSGGGGFSGGGGSFGGGGSSGSW
ncbi:MAG: TPM domain-containing protein [Ignavibacteriales bacterium]|nr:TPM domain-containing protein [Ignavibacteriales bacterium]